MLDMPDMQSIIIFIILLVGIILLLAVGGKMSKRKTTYSGKASKKKYSRWVFHRLAHNSGLSKNLIKILDNLIKRYKVKEPFLLFSNNRLLDQLVNRAMYSINNNLKLTTNQKENMTNSLFQIKQIIDSKAKNRLE